MENGYICKKVVAIRRDPFLTSMIMGGSVKGEIPIGTHQFKGRTVSFRGYVPWKKKPKVMGVWSLMRIFQVQNANFQGCARDEKNQRS